MNVLGITLGHDAGVAHVVDGELVAAFEAERWFRQKRYKLHCLDLEPGARTSGYQTVDVRDLELFLDIVEREWGTGFDGLAVQNQGRVQEYENLLRLLDRRGFRFGSTAQLDHHYSHAGLAYYSSPFADALVLSYDGHGNDGYTLLFEGTSAGGIRRLHSSETRFGESYNNLGYIVGVKPDVAGSTAGKTMGLAAYGARNDEWLPLARRYVRDYRKATPRTVDGVASYGAAHTISAGPLARIPELAEYADQPPRRRMRLSRGPAAPVAVRLPGPEHPLAQDLVHTVQAAWTEEVLELLRPFADPSRPLCVVGGCALNGIANFALQQSGMFADTWFVPNPSDCGLAAGAALIEAHRLAGTPHEARGDYASPYLGAEAFDLTELPRLRGRYPHRPLDPVFTPTAVARLVAQNRLVGVIRGRYELGPRALGNRSILCNPLDPDMRDRLNERVKHREWYRPFAPVAPAADAGRFFTNVSEIPYMSVICHTRPEWRDRMPAITHVDGSSRLQTIRPEHAPFLHETLRAFERLTGVPVLLNTSFNPGGEPILNYCEVGLQMLDDTDLDFVLIDDTLFCRAGREETLSLVDRELQPAA